jgi:hypothetical protein
MIVPLVLFGAAGSFAAVAAIVDDRKIVWLCPLHFLTDWQALRARHSFCLSAAASILALTFAMCGLAVLVDDIFGNLRFSWWLAIGVEITYLVGGLVLNRTNAHMSRLGPPPDDAREIAVTTVQRPAAGQARPRPVARAARDEADRLPATIRPHPVVLAGAERSANAETVAREPASRPLTGLPARTADGVTGRALP